MKSPTHNLLNKFSQLFNKSGAEDGDSETSPTSASDPSGHAALERMQKLKRRDDTVRANELNQLRGIIQDERGIRPRQLPDQRAARAQQPFAETGAQQQRAILDKIDGAEAHLAQWWGTGSAPLVAEPRPAPAGDDELELDFTGMLALSETPSVQPDPVFDTDALGTPTPAPSALESCLREAALLHASGAFEAAQSRLAAMLADPAIDRQAIDWLTFSLFEVYRCSGEQERFEALALDYANRFGRSPGEWYAIEDATSASQPLAQAKQALDAERAFWRCPALLDHAAWAELVAHHPQGSQVVSINWLPLQQIDPSLAQTLAEQLSAWSESPVELQWIGSDVLMEALQMCRLGCKPPASAPWWLMQLGLYCMLQQPQAFEEMAMAYCVALEISPPSWKPSVCRLVQADDVPLAPDFVATVPSVAPDLGAQALVTYASFELSGNVLGSNAAALRALARFSLPVSQMEVSCARLGRIDPEAAQALRNWLLACNARGCEVLFTHLPRLTLVYFQTLGLPELANLSAGAF